MAIPDGIQSSSLWDSIRPCLLSVEPSESNLHTPIYTRDRFLTKRRRDKTLKREEEENRTRREERKVEREALVRGRSLSLSLSVIEKERIEERNIAWPVELHRRFTPLLPSLHDKKRTWRRRRGSERKEKEEEVQKRRGGSKIGPKFYFVVSLVAFE